MFHVDLPPDSSWKWINEYSEDGHNRPCYYCGKLCNNFAGDPGEWSVGFPEKDELGKIKYHHMGCLLKRLKLLEEAYDIIHILLDDNFPKPISEIVNRWLKDYEDK
jgi:hypothetical protein